MNEREVAELRRRFRQDRSGISHVRGCYVNENREIVSRFDQSLGVLTREENEKLLTLLRRTLTGTLGKNLLDITFATQQVVHGAEHKRLMDLRASELKDEEAVGALFQAVIQSVNLEGNYMILLAHDAYDVPYRGKDGEEQEDASSEVFSYLICAICPVKLTKPALSYRVQEGTFCTKTADWVVSPPALGFLFPAFDDRSANIYDALYYTKDIQDVQEALVASVFGTPAPMPAAAQQESFRAVLGEALEEDCCLQVVQVGHVPLQQTDEEMVEGLAVGQVFLLRHLQDFPGSGFRRIVLTEDEQILPVQIHQHLRSRCPPAPYVVPVKGNEVKALKALKCLDLPLMDVVQHLGIHIGLHLPDAGHGQYHPHKRIFLRFLRVLPGRRPWAAGPHSAWRISRVPPGTR